MVAAQYGKYLDNKWTARLLLMIQKIVKYLLKFINKNKYFEIKIIRKNKDIEYLIKNWIKKIPELNRFNFKINEKNVDKIYSFYKKIIPIIHKNSKNVFLRNEFYKLKPFLENWDKKKINLLTSEANFIDSVFERSNNLNNRIVQKELRNYEKAYGKILFDKNFKYLWKNCDREKSLVLYFENNSHLLKKKRILHISPEKKLRDYINSNRIKFSIQQYLTSNFEDIKNVNHDLSYNIENIKEKSSRFDLIICHRVMEHVFDDKKAFKELMRILKKNGILNISFPETPNKKTSEWILQDITHNNHVRQYGYNFRSLLDKNKHKIKLDNFFFNKSNSFLSKNKIVPMRIYNIQKL